MSNAVFPAQVKGFTYNSLKTAEYSTLQQVAPNGCSLEIQQYTNPLWNFTLIWDYVYDTFYSPNNTQAYAPYTDLQTFMGFFTARRGKGDDFLYWDKNDYSAAGLRSDVWRPGWTYLANVVVIDIAGNAWLTTNGGISGAQYPFPYPPPPLVSISDGGITWVNQGFFPNGWPNAQVTLPVVTDGKNYYSPIQRTIGGIGTEDVTDLIPNTLQVWTGGSPLLSFTIQGPGLAANGSSYMGMYINWGIAPPATPVTASFQFYHRVIFAEDTQDFENWAQGLWSIGGGNSKLGGYLKLKSKRVPTI